MSLAFYSCPRLQETQEGKQMGSTEESLAASRVEAKGGSEPLETVGKGGSCGSGTEQCPPSAKVGCGPLLCEPLNFST